MSYSTYVAPPVVEDHPLVGRELEYNFQPYNRGVGEITEIRQHPNEARVTVTLRVLRGYEISRLFQHTATKSNAGRTLTAYGVSEKILTEAVEGKRVFTYVYPL